MVRFIYEQQATSTYKAHIWNKLKKEQIFNEFWEMSYKVFKYVLCRVGDASDQKTYQQTYFSYLYLMLQ